MSATSQLVLKNSWVKEFSGAVTVCDTEGIILEMNDKALAAYSKYGGEALVGTNVLDCHPEAACAKLEKLMATQRANTYTIEKGGVRKLIHQFPWYSEGEYRGFVELTIEIPSDMPHFVRD